MIGTLDNEFTFAARDQQYPPVQRLADLMSLREAAMAVQQDGVMDEALAELDRLIVEERERLWQS
jgi:hypothetical protein